MLKLVIRFTDQAIADLEIPFDELAGVKLVSELDGGAGHKEYIISARDNPETQHGFQIEGVSPYPAPAQSTPGGVVSHAYAPLRVKLSNPDPLPPAYFITHRAEVA